MNLQDIKRSYKNFKTIEDFIETTIREVLEEVRLEKKETVNMRVTHFTHESECKGYNQAVTELNNKIDGILGDKKEASQRDIKPSEWIENRFMEIKGGTNEEQWTQAILDYLDLKDEK